MMHGLLMEAVKTVASARTNHTFSITCVDFVLRTVFSLSASQRRHHVASVSQADPGEEIDRTVLANAHKSADPVMLTFQRTSHQGGVASDDDDIDPIWTPEEVDLAKTCLEVQRDLRASHHRILRRMGEFDHCRTIRTRAAREGRSITEKDFEGGLGEDDELSEASSNEEEREDRGVEEGAVLPAEVAAALEERITIEVAQMFSPALFRRGRTLAEVVSGLHRLVDMNPTVVHMKMNIFERMWLAEKIQQDKDLQYLCGGGTSEIETSTTVDAEEERLAPLLRPTKFIKPDYGRVAVNWCLLSMTLVMRKRRKAHNIIAEVAESRKWRQDKSWHQREDTESTMTPDHFIVEQIATQGVDMFLDSFSSPILEL